MSNTTERSGMLVGLPGQGPGGAGNGTLDRLRRGAGVFGRQREATVFVVTAALLLYFGLTNPSTFGSRINAIDLLSEIAAPIIIIAIGEVLLLICGEIDLSVGFIFACAPFVMFYLNVYYGIPSGLAILISLAFGVGCGWVNGFLTVTLGLPSFITTLGTGFILAGFALYTSHAEAKIGRAHV